MSLTSGVWKNLVGSLTVKDLIEQDKTFQLIVLDAEETVIKALEVLTDNHIYSAPVKGKNGIIGIIDLIDILTFATMKFSTISLNAWDSYRAMDDFGNKKIGNLIGASGRNEWKPISYKEPLTHVMELLSNPNVHRVPVVNERNDVVGIITQSRIVSWINANHSRLGNSFLKEKVGDCFLRTKVFSINSELFLIEAFKMIYENAVSAVAVVDNEGKFIGAVSPTDLKYTHFRLTGEIIQDFYKSIKDFKHLPTTLKERVFMSEEEKQEPIFVHEKDTMEKVLNLLVTKKVHRVFVTDEFQRPTGVISLCDLIRLLKTT